MGGDVTDPHDAIMGAANYLAANGGAEGTDERARQRPVPLQQLQPLRARRAGTTPR